MGAERSHSAKVVIAGRRPFRVARCHVLGAEVVLAEDVHAAFALAERIERDEGRAFVHPFEGPRTALGTATLGRELLLQAPGVDAVLVPVGGGGLAAGVATAIKLIKPGCQVIGVEPEANDVMFRSFQSGKPERVPEGGYRTIADSLSPPYTLPYSLELCLRHLDDLVLGTDDAMREAVAVLPRAKPRCSRLRLGHGALMGPLRDRLRGSSGADCRGTNIARSGTRVSPGDGAARRQAAAGCGRCCCSHRGHRALVGSKRRSARRSPPLAGSRGVPFPAAHRQAGGRAVTVRARNYLRGEVGRRLLTVWRPSPGGRVVGAAVTVRWTRAARTAGGVSFSSHRGDAGPAAPGSRAGRSALPGGRRAAPSRSGFTM